MKKPKKQERSAKPVEEQVNAAIAENRSAFEKTARRVIGAVEELNQALAEAHKNGEMRVEFFPEEGPLPRTYTYRIYRLSHASMKWLIEHDDKDGNRVMASFKPTTEKPNDFSATAVRGDGLDRAQARAAREARLAKAT